MTSYIAPSSSRKRTKLEWIQREIDLCNRKNGCDSKCSPADQRTCPLLKAHAARIEECREKGLPFTAW